jgi:signal transduction histidine kinase
MKELGDYVVTGNEDELTEFHQAQTETQHLFDTWHQLLLKEQNLVDATHRRVEMREQLVLAQARKQYLDLVHISRQVIALVQEGHSEEAMDLLEHRVETAFEGAFHNTIENQLQDERVEIAQIQDATWTLYSLAQKLTVGLAVFAFVCVIAVSRIVTRAIAQPLARLREAAMRIGHGHLDTDIDITSHDEIGELAVTLSQMAHDLNQTTTSIDHLRREVQQRHNAEKNLETINEELTHFAYVVSHDLKAPLRGIKLLTEWLCTDYYDRLDEAAHENLDLLQSRVTRMHNLIEGVLQYSRVGRIHEDIVDVDLNDLLAQIVDALAPPEHIAIRIKGPLPTLRGEPTRIGQVFQNLLSNAIKYMDKPAGRIAVTCEDTDDTWTFHVADNGPGIEEQYFERIFMIFQTLTARDEFESTGVGLTLVKKIVEHAGGRIWLASEVGKGSTFSFTFPKQRADAATTMPLEGLVASSRPQGNNGATGH